MALPAPVMLLSQSRSHLDSHVPSQSCPELLQESLVRLFLADCGVCKVIYREILSMRLRDSVACTPIPFEAGAWM